MEIRDKVEARKAELRAQAQRLEDEARERNRQVREAARREVEGRLSMLDGPSDPTAEPTPVQPISATEEELEKELDAALDKRASNAWSSGENTMLLVLFIGSIAALFLVGWKTALLLFVSMLIYQSAINAKYKRSLREELAAKEAALD